MTTPRKSDAKIQYFSDIRKRKRDFFAFLCYFAAKKPFFSRTPAPAGADHSGDPAPHSRGSPARDGVGTRAGVGRGLWAGWGGLYGRYRVGYSGDNMGYTGRLGGLYGRYGVDYSGDDMGHTGRLGGLYGRYGVDYSGDDMGLFCVFFDTWQFLHIFRQLLHIYMRF